MKNFLRFRWRHRAHTVTSRCPTKLKKLKLPNFVEMETRRLSASSEGSVSSLDLSVDEMWLKTSEAL